MKTKLIALLLGLCFSAAAFCANVKLTPDDKKIAIEIDGKPFSNYFFADGDGLPYTRPFFSAVHSANGEEVTADQYKLQAAAGKDWKKMEHPHHRSVWVGQGEVNGADHWALKPDGSNPKQRHLGFAKMVENGFVEQLEWENNEHKPILKETRTIQILVYSDGARAIDLRSEYIALEDVEFGDTKEAGMVAVRVVKELSKDENLALSTGAKGMKDCWGKAAKWSDICGPLDGLEGVARIEGVAIFDDPKNPKAPTRWHIRDYGLNGANIFGLSAFDKAPKGTGAVKLAKDQSMTFHYQVVFHSSSRAEAKLDEKWAEFAK